MLEKPRKKRVVYLDHAATTYTDKSVIKEMVPFMEEIFGNPSALYGYGRIANSAINNAREKIATLMGAMPENIIFTSGGTESDNTAIFGVATAHQDKGKHIISIGIEHHAVLHPLEKLEKMGWDITYIKVDKTGTVDAKEVAKAIRKDTVLISVMYANNEIGTIEPIDEIGKKILKYRKENNSIYPFFHTDACQAAGYLDINVEKLHVDLLTLNGSKMYGPKGVGMLYVRRGVKINPYIIGGSQERRMRAGTENVAGIVGLAKAFEMAQNNKKKENDRITKLRNYLWKELNKKIKNIRLNGPFLDSNRLCNNLNVTFMDIEGEALILYLDEYGIMCSTGSACTSESLDPSHVLGTIGLPYEYAHGSLRFSFGHCNDKKDIDYLMKYLPAIVEQLREISPVNMKKQKHARYKK